MKMSEPNPTNPTPDDLLADFTDRVLDEETPVASSTDAELRGLEETVLRLKRSLPQKALDEKILRHLQVNFKTRIRKVDSPLISTWQFLRPRQRLVLAFASVALVALLIAFPFLPFNSGSIEGTAGIQAQGVILVVGIVCVVALLVWARRHK